MPDLQPLPRQAACQLAHFQVHVTAVDNPTGRRRWNGGPMASDDASEALRAGVEAFEAALRGRGFSAGRTQSGVHATETSA